MLPNVYVVTISDVLEWMQKPTPCDTTNGQTTCNLVGKFHSLRHYQWPNQCTAALLFFNLTSLFPGLRSCGVDSARPAPCPFEQMQHCVLKRQVGEAWRDRSLKSCQICPDEYPWLGNPDGNVLPVSIGCFPSMQFARNSYLCRLKMRSIRLFESFEISCVILSK